MLYIKPLVYIKKAYIENFENKIILIYNTKQNLICLSVAILSINYYIILPNNVAIKI